MNNLNKVPFNVDKFLLWEDKLNIQIILKKLFSKIWVEFIEKEFLEFFSDDSFLKQEPVNMIPHNHWSILFTNSIIISLINKIKEGESIHKYSISQPCIRTQNLWSEISWKVPKYISCFNMVWAIEKIENYSEFIDKVLNFIYWYFGELNIKIAMKDSHKTHHKNRKNRWLERIDHPNNYYERSFWSSNIDSSTDAKAIDISWKWISIMIKKWEGHEELGNLLIISQSWEEKYVVFWFWIETMISILWNEKWTHQIECKWIQQEILDLINFNNKNSLHIHLLDSYDLIRNITALWIYPWTGKQKYVAKKAMMKFINVWRKIWLTDKELINIIWFIDDKKLSSTFEIKLNNAN
jgi:hypothetical protein